MQQLSPMRPSTVASAALALLVTSVAHAGGYVSAGVGGSAALRGELSSAFDSSEHESARIAVGQRIGPLGLEAAYWSAGLTGVGGFAAGEDWTTRTLGIDLKYFVSVIGPLAAYPKLGLNRTWLDGPEFGVSDHRGGGVALGAGLEYRFVDLPLANAAVWGDYTHHRATLSDGAGEVSGSMGLASLGLSVGF
jgi:hypothetical protein